MSRIIGIDPSLTSTGLAVIDTEDRLVVPVWTVGSSGHRADPWHARHARFRALTAQIIATTDADDADLAVIEAPTLGQGRQGGHLDRHGLWWSIYGALADLHVTVVPVSSATRQKYATGKGNAGKDQVLLAVARRYPHIEVANNNEADAVVLAAIGARYLGEPVEDHLPKSHLDAMVKVGDGS